MSDDITRAPIIIDGLPDLCEKGFTGWADLLKTIFATAYAAVPNTITNVIISNEEPNNSQTDYLWGKLDNAGNLVGFAIFAQGEWRVVTAPTPPGGLILVAGDSDNPPPGFVVPIATLVGTSNLIKMQESWNPPGDGEHESEGPWTLFHVYYVGF